MATRKSLNQDPRTTGVDPLAADSVAKSAAMPTESAKSAVEVAEANHEDTVMTSVEKAFHFTDDNHVTHKYPTGAVRMPRSHATHWFAKAHGCVIVD